MRPAVLIHGLIGNLNDPGILGERDARIYAPDLLGYGDNFDFDTTGMTLRDQADHIATFVKQNRLAPANIVGHSVGGTVAVLLADKYPELVCSVISVEGNFTLEDAFWTAKIAAKTPTEVAALLESYRNSPDSWLESAGLKPTAWTRTIAQCWLHYQPASTIHRQAVGVVETTSSPNYLEKVERLIETSLPFHLVAGANSLSEWNVPEWVLRNAASLTCVPDSGHLMMVSHPREFCRVVFERMA
jgi:pimeloyl-ACP methyl ester carboxylesterase